MGAQELKRGEVKATDPSDAELRGRSGCCSWTISAWSANLKNSHGDGCQRIFPERTLKSQSVKIQRITSCSQQILCLYLSCSPVSHSYTPASTILHRCFALLKLGGAQGRVALLLL